MVRIAIVPGNGTGNVINCNWYSWAQRALHRPAEVECILRNMPDPLYARCALGRC